MGAGQDPGALRWGDPRGHLSPRRRGPLDHHRSLCGSGLLRDKADDWYSPSGGQEPRRRTEGVHPHHEAIRTAPGVLAVEVDYEKGEAVVGIAVRSPVPKDRILDALDKAGYSGSFIEESAGETKQ